MKKADSNDKRDVSKFVGQVRYHIMTPGSLASRPMQDRVYGFWKDLWRDVFGQVGKADALNPDEFFRQNLIVALAYQDEIVGFHLYTYFDLNWQPALEHSYFHGVQSNSIESLKNKGVEKAMAMEYLSVNPQWRKSRSGVAFGDVLIALGFKILPFTECQVALGTARTDVKVDEAGIKLGCFTADQPPIEKYDYVCRLIHCMIGDVRPHPDEQTRRLIDHLWNTRIDETGITLNPAEKLKIAG